MNYEYWLHVLKVFKTSPNDDNPNNYGKAQYFRWWVFVWSDPKKLVLTDTMLRPSWIPINCMHGAYLIANKYDTLHMTFMNYWHPGPCSLINADRITKLKRKQKCLFHSSRTCHMIAFRIIDSKLFINVSWDQIRWQHQLPQFYRL